MSQEPEALFPRIALLLGTLILVNVLIEAALSALVGNPTQPPFSTPETRFALAGGLVPRLAEIIGGAGLVTAARWNHPQEHAQRRVGWAFLGAAGIALLPLILLIPAFLDYRVADMPAEGLIRFRTQFGRMLIFYATVSLTLGTFGRVLLTRSGAPRQVASDSPA